jgi:hypothetical protein
MVQLMKRWSFHRLIQNKVLLTVIAMSLVLGLGSVAFISLNGLAHPESTQEMEGSPEATDDVLVVTATQEASQAAPVPFSEQARPESETQGTQSQASNGAFEILRETSCIPDHAEHQVGSVVDALDTDRLMVSVDGETYPIKFLGIDTRVPNGDLNGIVLSANEILVGKTIALLKGGVDADESGNLLRYVFTENTFVNLALIEKGLATVSDDGSLGTCKDLFLDAQETAQGQELGTWERLKPEDWGEWPVIPVISENALEIYLQGLQAGTNPKLFSIIGDCQNIPGGSLFRKVNWDDFSLPPDLEHLQPTLDNFRTIWSREPVTVGGGFIPASMFSTYWTDTDRCDPIETPLDCEFRLNNASIVLISIGSDQKPGTGEDFDHYMRKIVEYSIENKRLPIISTDAYATDEGFPLNLIMAQIAYDYDIPLWNFWAAVQDLPNHGLKEDNFHISAEAFAIKRITGIQVLHALLTAAQQHQD